ncbi:MAG: SpoIIE family protein phosphatase [Acidimicrobiales bacterium]
MRPSTCCALFPAPVPHRPGARGAQPPADAASQHAEEFISVCIVVFDLQRRRCATPRPATRRRGCGTSARCARCATGLPLMLSPGRRVLPSFEIRLDENDPCLMYTDGLSEVRNGAELPGEERRQRHQARPRRVVDVLCKSPLSAAQDFSSGPINDDVATAVRKV